VQQVEEGESREELRLQQQILQTNEGGRPYKIPGIFREAEGILQGIQDHTRECSQEKGILRERYQAKEESRTNYYLRIYFNSINNKIELK